MTDTPRPPRRVASTVITSAEESYEEQFRARKRRYMITMGTRFPLMFAGFACYQIPWLAVTLIALSIPLPWIAVLIANDRPARKTVAKRAGVINHERALPAGGRSTVEHDVIDS